MANFSLWNSRKGNTFKSMDLYVKNQYTMGGTAGLVHKYIGPITSNADGEYVPDRNNPDGTNELTVQDVLFLENRDRMYDDDIYEIRLMYQLQDQDFDLSQFGFFLPNDIMFLSVHQNDTVDIMGRRLMNGDVIELPHLRDDLLLDPTRPAVNKFYTILEVSREAGGYSPLWYPHTLRLKVEPMPDSQEYADILDQQAGEDGDLTLRDILSTYNDEIGISDAIQELAEAEVPEFNFETAHFYYVPDEYGDTGDPWIFAGDGEPPNGAVLLGSGNYFPVDAVEGEYWLRTDYTPNVLFRKEGKCWIRKEVDYRRKFTSAHRIIESFINNNDLTVMPNSETMPEKQALSKAVKPRRDL